MDTVAIVGRAKETRHLAPFDRDDVAIWAFNYYGYEQHAAGKRLSALFELHPDALTCDRYDDGYRDFLRAPHPFPIYTHPDADISDIPAATPYPRDEINAVVKTGVFIGEQERLDFYTSSPAFALALAILKGYRRIELYGIEVNPLEGYRQQAECLYFWMGRASGMGIEISIPPQSRLFSDPTYPPIRSISWHP